MLSFEETDSCRVTNHADKPLKLMYASREYVIEPGKARAVPVQCALIAFGDPRAVGTIRSVRNPITNEVGWVPDRASEIRRLRLRYGIQDGPEHTFEDKTGNIPDTVPDVTVEFMADGDWEKVVTVLEDPSGTNAVLETNQAVDIQTLQASLERTQRQLAQLIDQQTNDTVLAPEEDIPTDNPTVARAEAKAAAKK